MTSRQPWLSLAALFVSLGSSSCAGGEEDAAAPAVAIDAGVVADVGSPVDAAAPPDAGAPAALDAATDASPDAGSPDADAAAPLDAPGDSTAEAGGPDAGDPTLYAAPDGTGTSCTLPAPCPLAFAVTVARGRTAAMTADLAVVLRGGTYRLAATLALGAEDSGQNGHRVIYQAYPGEVPVLSGAVQITGFSPFDPAKSVWRAPLPALPAGARGRQLFVNGVRAARARTAGAPGGVSVTATGFTTTDATLATFANGSAIEVVQDNDWKHMRCPLQGVSALAGGGTALTVSPGCWRANGTNVPNVAFPFNGNGLPSMSGISWVENAYELLAPGTFYFDAGAGFVYYLPRAGEDVGAADAELPVLETLVSLSGTPGHLAPRNDDDPSIAYAGSWQRYAARGFGDLDDDVHATGASGDAATFSFTGTGLQVIGETNADEGAFQVYVDGAQGTTRAWTQSSASRVAAQVLYSVLGLPSGPHTVKIVSGASAGQFTVLDGFVVVPEAIAPVHDVGFSGLTFAYGTWDLPSTAGYIDNQAGVLWDTTATVPTAARIPAAVQVHRGQRIAFTGDSFLHLGGAALDLADGTQDSSVVGCLIDDASGGGISVGEVDDYFQTEPSLMTSGDTLTDDAISNIGIDYHDAVGIWGGYTRALTIAHDDIGHTPYSGISLGWGWGWASPCAQQSAQGLPACRHGTIYAGQNRILNNYVHDVMGRLFDGGPIYTNGGQGDGDGSATSVLAGNFVTAGNHTNNMLYQDEGSSYWDTHDNVTSLGGADWIGMWTPTIHDITVGPVNYTDNASALDNGTSITLSPPTVVTGGAWPASALALMSAAGLEAAYVRPRATIDDDDQAVSYSGAWAAQGSRGLGDYQDNVHYTTTNGDSVTLSFTGTGVSFVGEKDASQGEVAWSIDGQSRGVVDTSVPSSSPRQLQQVLLSAAALALGSHVLTVTKTSGTFMTVDAFRVQP